MEIPVLRGVITAEAVIQFPVVIPGLRLALSRESEGSRQFRRNDILVVYPIWGHHTRKAHVTIRLAVRSSG
jgi:hypothetical protein